MTGRRCRGRRWFDWGIAAALTHAAALAQAPLQDLSAQVATGTVTEVGTSQPVVGALVRLRRPDGQPGAYVLTGADGRYRLRAPGPGSYMLSVERIGYASTDAGPVHVPAGAGPGILDIALSPTALDLEGLAVTGRTRRCVLVAEAATNVQSLWGEARKALAAAVWTEEQGALRFRLRSREATLDPRSLAVRDMDARVRSEWGANTVRSLPAAELHEDGYARVEADSSWVLYAPDARALLSDEFLAGHCLDVAEDVGPQPGLVGLAFAPVPGRIVPDIRGVIWVQGATAVLHSVDFNYTGLPSRPGLEYAGGSIRFEELADGRWIVRDWFIRGPVVGVVRTGGVSGTVRRLMVTAVSERGTEVLSAEGEGVAWSADQATGSVVGTVFDSTASAPLAGAEVRLAGRAWRTRTDAAGAFTLPAVPPGTYLADVRHPRLDSLRVEGVGREVEVRAHVETELRLGVPSRETILALDCRDREGSVVVGWVTARGGAVAGAAVVAQGAVDGEGNPIVGITDVDGGFRLCGLPAGTTARLAARVGPVTSSLVEVETRADAPVRVDLRVEVTPSVDGAPRRGEGRPTLSGRVVDAATGALLSDALVEFLSDGGQVVGRTISGSQGRFTYRPTGSEPLAVRASLLGYATQTGSPLPPGRRDWELEVRLAPEAIAVEGVVVSVEARSLALDRNGFYERQALAWGQFLDLDAIQAAVPTRTSDILLRLPGVRTANISGEAGRADSRRIQLRAALRFSSDQRCLPGVYVDGVLVRPPHTSGSLDDYPTEDALVSPHDIEAIEVYDTPAVTPARFRAPGPPCGVLVIWTRSGGGG